MSANSVTSVSADTFQQEVIERSAEVPVLVDFWATWCQPCKTLGPVLEKLARELEGRLVLAKVDVDQNPDLAQAFRVQSVPSVMLVAKGRVVDGFTGVLPEARVRALVEPHLPPLGPLEAALAAEAEGRRDDAIRLLRQHLRDAPDDVEPRVELARMLVDADRAPEARKVLERLGDEGLESDAARAVLARLALGEEAGDLEEARRAVEADAGDLDARIRYGRALVAAQRHEEGLEQLYEAARRDVRHSQDAPRKALLEMFQLLGPSHPLTLEYQRRLSLLLCS